MWNSSNINYREENECLFISLNQEGKKEIDEIINNEHDVFGKWLDLTEYENCNGVFDLVHPQKIEALTDAPIIAFNISYDDDGELREYEDTKYYWFADYAVLNEFEILKEGNEVKFIKG
ncbi:MAG: hypothetical protein KKH44_07830 [Bacteroidetes bacterium]|nr:hypothetical protein [Bacteroidota bacterium]